MLTRTLLAVIALTFLVFCESYKRSNSGVSATEKTVLYDFREASVPPPPKIDAATQRKVFSSIAQNYLVDSEDCLKAASSKTVVLQILSVAHGSFTAPAVQETAYLVQQMTCSEILRSARNPADRIISRLAIFANEKPVAIAEITGFALLKTFDLNSDGKDELLLAGGEGETWTARLVRFDKTSVTTVEDFGSVAHNPCIPNSYASARIMDAVVLSYLPRPNPQMPSFTAERFRAECPAAGQPPRWTQISR